MPLQNRVGPFGELIATPARGTVVRQSRRAVSSRRPDAGSRRWASRQWICCVLSFKGRRHNGLAGRATPICSSSMSHRARGRPPALLRMPPRGCESICREMGAGERRRRAARARDGCGAAERAARRPRRSGRTRCAFAELPDGAFVTLNDARAMRCAAQHLLRWSVSGYTGKSRRPRGAANVAHAAEHRRVLSAGYPPQWHPSADAL